MSRKISLDNGLKFFILMLILWHSGDLKDEEETSILAQGGFLVAGRRCAHGLMSAFGLTQAVGPSRTHGFFSFVKSGDWNFPGT
ncbi:MAG: hypothetical protein JRJ78_14630 [Deltaproteobacteria bacterium]|nr:hypothetical protein [Deltaproteobacteria bacterium]